MTRKGRTRALAGTAFLVALLPLFGCQKPESTSDRQNAKTAEAGPASPACTGQAGYERLKALAFEKAREVRSGDEAVLDRLATTSVVRMENAAAKSGDDALNVTMCSGRLVIELPPGTEDIFSGAQRLAADVRYTVQKTGEGGLAYQLDGAEPIVYRLAAIDLKTRTAQATAPAARPSPSQRRLAAPATTAIKSHAASSRRWADAEPRLSSRGRPSFNCRFARSRSEQMICRDERLAALDRVTMSLYARTARRTDPESRFLLRRTQTSFLARRQGCGSPACIAATYQDRMDEIDRIAMRD